jgi:hypothetical protein
MTPELLDLHKVREIVRLGDLSPQLFESVVRENELLRARLGEPNGRTRDTLPAPKEGNAIDRLAQAVDQVFSEAVERDGDELAKEFAAHRGFILDLLTLVEKHMGGLPIELAALASEEGEVAA